MDVTQLIIFHIARQWIKEAYFLYAIRHMKTGHIIGIDRECNFYVINEVNRLALV